ncbi:MAG: FkbM family methyltransferase, partial [Chthoniobacterales bacterium]
RIHPQNYGLSDESKRLKFFQLSDNTGHSSFAAAEEHADDNPVPAESSMTECDVIQFDEATKRLSLPHPATPSWITKIDVEGYEMKVLFGMTDALSHKAFKGICIELFKDNLSLCGTSIEQIDDLLRSYGYQQIPNRSIEHDPAGRNHNAFYVPADLEIGGQCFPE